MGRDFILLAFTVVIVGGMGSHRRRRGRRAVAHAGAGDRVALHLAGLDRPDRVRDHGADADGAPAGPVRAARPCLTRSTRSPCGQAMCWSAVLSSPAALVFAAIGAALDDTFYLRLGDRGADLRRACALGRYPARLHRSAVARPGALFRARRLCLRAGADGGAVVLAGDGRGARRGARASGSIGGAHRQPRARRLFRADHLRHGAGRRQGRLQHARARRVRRADRRADHRHQSRRRSRCRARRRPASSWSCSRSSSCCTPSRPTARYAVRPAADRAARQRAARAVPRLSHRVAAACSLSCSRR